MTEAVLHYSIKSSIIINIIDDMLPLFLFLFIWWAQTQASINMNNCTKSHNHQPDNSPDFDCAYFLKRIKTLTGSPKRNYHKA